MPYLHKTHQGLGSGAGLSCELTAVMGDGGTSLAMATMRDEPGPRLRQLATALAHALFHLRDQRDKTCFGTLLDIFITILPLIPTDQDENGERMAGALQGTPRTRHTPYAG